MDTRSNKNVTEPIDNADPEVQEIIRYILETERDKLYQDKPRVLKDLIEKIKKVVK